MGVWRTVVIAALLLAACWQAAAAQNEAADPRQAAYEKRVAAGQHVDELAARLKGRTPDLIPVRLVNDYYRAALEQIQYGIEYCGSSNGYLMYTLEGYRDGGWAGDWPANPLDGWQPLPILSPDDPPVPGGVVWRTCPAEFYSAAAYMSADGTSQEYWPVKQSYEMSIYGADLRTAPDAAPQPGNAPWANVLPGTLAMTGLHTPPFSETVPEGTDLDELLAKARDTERHTAEALEYAATKISYPEDYDWKHHDMMLYNYVSLVTEADKLSELRPELEAAADPAADSDALEQYLANLMWYIYAGGYICESLTGRLSFDPADLAAQNLLPVEPLNPLAGWRTARVLDVGEGFSPGDLFVQYCDPMYFTSGKRGIYAHSFQFGVYGAREVPPDLELRTGIDYNSDWARVPDGALAITGGFMQSLLQTDYKRAVCFT